MLDAIATHRVGDRPDRFEPRLKNVAVAIHANVDKADRRLRLRITGVLRTEPVPERVEFDSELESSVATIGVSVVS